MKGFHCEYESKSASSAQTSSGAAAISISDTIAFTRRGFSCPKPGSCENFLDRETVPGGEAMATEQQTDTQKASVDGGGAEGDSLSITDNRTGETYEVEVSDGTVRAMDLRQIKVSEDDFGLMSYDP